VGSAKKGGQKKKTKRKKGFALQARRPGHVVKGEKGGVKEKKGKKPGGAGDAADKKRPEIERHHEVQIWPGWVGERARNLKRRPD